MRTSGFPVVAEPSGDSVLPAVFRVVNPTPEKCTPGAIVSRCLRQLSDNAVVVVDSDGRFYATEDATAKTALLDATVGDTYGGTPQRLTLEPEAGATGIAFKWQVDSSESWSADWHEEFTEGIKPLRSLASVVDRFNRSLALGERAFFVVDQELGLLHFLIHGNKPHVREECDTIATDSEAVMVVDMTAGTGAGNTNLPFENPR